MKKIFLTLMIAVGFVLASCAGNGLSNKSGEVSFSVSANEIGRYIAASREVETTGEDPIVFEIVAQIKGSKGYYAWIRKQAVYTPQTQAIVEEGASGSGAANPNPNPDPYGSEIPQDVLSQFEQDIIFNFKRIPAKQTYKVMVDILIKDQNPETDFIRQLENGTDYWVTCYSGAQEDITVIPGASNPVTIELEKMETVYDVPSNFAVKVTYTNKDSKNVTEEVSMDEILQSKYSFAKNEGNTQFWFAHSGRDWYPVSALKLVFAEDSHFINGSQFRLVGVLEEDTATSDVSHKKATLIEAQNGELDLIQLYSRDAVKTTDPFIEFESFIKDSTSLLFIERFNLYIPSSKNNFGSYSTDYNSKFVKDTSIKFENNNKARFRLTIPLTDILGDDPLEKGDSIAFMLSDLSVRDEDGNDVFPGQVAYQLQKDGWESLLPDAVDANNTTINYSEIAGDKVCAANFIDGDEKFFQLYIDAKLEKVENATELNGSLQLSYKIFPASEKVFVFHKAYAEWEQNSSTVSDHRKEMIFNLNSYFQKLGQWPAENSKITINVGGTFKTLSNDADEEIVSGVELKSEIFDNLKFDKDDSSCGFEGHSAYYHPLSNSSANGNTFNSLVLSENGTLGSIIFANILKPHITQETHDYRLQLYKSGGQSSDNSLLIIKNFSISVSVDGGSSNPEGTVVDLGD